VKVELHSDPIVLTTATTSEQGTTSVDVQIPASAPDGQHNIVVIGVDSDGQPIERRAPLTLDLAPPKWVSLVATPSASPGRSITITARVTDASGVTHVGLQAKQDGATSSTPWCDGYATLTSGTAHDGTWTMMCQVPPAANVGTYTVYPYGSDVVGNWFNTDGGPSDPTRATFTVT
jgi:hypothetical protein